MIHSNAITIPHVLFGGSSTRPRPLSREAFPKQFVPPIQGKSLLAITLQRAALLVRRVVCMANAEHRLLLDDPASEAGLRVEQILEPVERNTAAAMAFAALLAESETLLLFMAADHYIPDA